MTFSTEIFSTPRTARRWAFALQAMCWIAGVIVGLTFMGVLVLGTFEALECAQAPFTVGDAQ